MKMSLPAGSLRFILILIFSFLFFSGFISCRKDSVGDTITLTFTSWRTDDIERMNRINALFTQTHPDIQINFQPFDTEVYDSIALDRLKDGAGADIIFLRSYDKGRKFYDNGYLYDLTNVIPDLAAFNPMVVNAWSTKQGITYGLPSVGVTHGIYYQKALFAKYNIQEPTTWIEFIAACETLYEGGETVFAQGTLDSWTLYEIAYSGLGANFYGGEAARQDLMSGTKKLTDPNFLAAFSAVNSLKMYLPEGYQMLGYDAMKQLFTSGKAAMFLGGSWEISTFEDMGADSSEIGWFAPPVVTPGDKLQYCFHVDAGIGINKNTKNMEAAIEYLKWLSGTQYAQALMDELPGFFSYTPGILTMINPLAQEMYDASLTANLTVRTMCERLSVQEPSGSTLMGNALNGMMNGDYTAETAASYVQTQLDTWYNP